MYIEDGSIHSEEYMLLYEIHPKVEVEWVGLTKTFVHFYPYNKDSPYYRFARTNTGGLVFEGSSIKGRWLAPPNPYEFFQEISVEAVEVLPNICEAHRFWYGLYADIIVVSGKAIKVRVLNGFSGKLLRTFTIKGDYEVENVYVTFVNHELFICLYDPQQDRSQVTKVEFFTNVDAKKDERELMELQREYTIYSKILQLKKVKNAYYLTTFSRRRLSLLTVAEKALSNRRPHLYQKQQSPFEKRLVISDAKPFDNILDIYGVVMEYNHTVERVTLFEEPQSKRVFTVLKHQNSD